MFVFFFQMFLSGNNVCYLNILFIIEHLVVPNILVFKVNYLGVGLNEEKNCVINMR